VPRAHATGLLAVALLATGWAGRASPADREAPTPWTLASGLPLPDVLTWLQEEVEAYGKFHVEYRGERVVVRARFVYRLIPQARESCTVSVRLEVTTLGDDLLPADPSLATGHESMTGTFHLGDVRIDAISLRRWPESPRVHAFSGGMGTPVSCVRVPLRRDARRSTSATDPGLEYEYESGEICLTDAGAAERVARGMRHVARLCGARPGASGAPVD
jgi:hypothetical protein